MTKQAIKALKIESVHRMNPLSKHEKTLSQYEESPFCCSLVLNSFDCSCNNSWKFYRFFLFLLLFVDGVKFKLQTHVGGISPRWTGGQAVLQIRLLVEEYLILRSLATLDELGLFWFGLWFHQPTISSRSILLSWSSLSRRCFCRSMCFNSICDTTKTNREWVSEQNNIIAGMLHCHFGA